MIATTSCAPCHGTPGASEGNLDMSTRETAYAKLVGVPASGMSCGGKGTLVVPGQPGSSIFYLKISVADPSPCGSKMPLGQPSVTQAQDDLTKAWIEAGAPND